MTCNTDRVLDYWHSVEFFNSYDLDQQLEDARGENKPTFSVASGDLTVAVWEDIVAHSCTLYLVPFDVSMATRIVEEYVAPGAGPQSEIERVRDGEMAPEGLTCFAKLTLGHGTADIDGMSISALPWALGQLQRGEMAALGADRFEAGVSRLKADLKGVVSGVDGLTMGPDMLVDIVKLLHAWAAYIPAGDCLAWVVVRPGSERKSSTERVPVGDPRFAVSSEDANEDTRDEEEKEADKDLPILNSFYVHDLTQARKELKESNAPRALAAYLSASDAPKVDLDSAAGQREVLETLRPRNGIVGRWPSAPSNIQSLMQQYALNKMKAMKPGELLAVNGPPGTGKTTLLRDLIAHLVVERAKVLASFKDWKEGVLDDTVDAVFATKTYKIPLLVPALTGFEIVVASTNNGAVENLSLELPQRKSIDPERIETLSYFRPLATKYAGCHATKRWSEPEPVWGLISAALGKQANRKRFNDVFVNRAAKPGDKPGNFVKNVRMDFPSWDAKGAMSYWRYRDLTKNTRKTFSAAQGDFRIAQNAYDAEMVRLDRLDERLRTVQSAWPRIVSLASDALDFDTGSLSALSERLTRLAERIDEGAQVIERRLGPPLIRWITMWFRRSLYKQWCDASENAHFVRGIRDQLTDLKPQIDEAAVALWDGSSLATKTNQSQAFWQGKKLNVLRSDLFSASMALHEAFFHEAQSNDMVFALSRMLSRPPHGVASKALWQWFFMLTPVVSSTFASVRRQFAGLGPEDLGWLVVDEAGQAVPQAAVGAIMRAQRVVVVGDPLQIPPVVTQSTRLLARLGDHWLKEHRSRYAVDNHSVQSLADRCYPFGVKHPIASTQFIGIPLVMHRRCDNPMFDIANSIAYNGRMEHAKENPSEAHKVLGPSAWWQVDGESQDGTKYIEAHGLRVFDAMVALYVEGVDRSAPRMPGAFVITPFREVKTGLIKLLGDEGRWQRALARHNLPMPKDLTEWIKSRVGTVHTFQGKESDVVFFVLGCDENRLGAISWASSEPNLLNVAVTRAKTHVYVVGDIHLWGHREFFSTALAMLSQGLSSTPDPLREQVLVTESEVPRFR